MAYLNRVLSFLSRLFNPRPYLARDWKSISQKYERNLRLNKTVSPEIVEAVIKEKNRIQALFTELLPEFAGRIFIVPINEVYVEQCFVFVWENDLYVAVSAALIGRPIDYPEDTGIVKAWEWIARHEIAHVRFCHLPWLFYTRRIFLGSQWLFFIYAAFTYLQVVDGSWFNSVLAFVAGAWVLQTIVGLACELSADLFATNSVDDAAVLEDSKKALERMTYQAQTKLSAPLGKVLYFSSTLLVDPHTPLIARKWLLARRAKRLQEALTS